MEQEALSEIRRPVLFIPVNEVNRMKENGLLEIIAAHRTIADLDGITAYNQCGAAYGAAAYRFGMEDGIRVRMEMEEVMRL